MKKIPQTYSNNKELARVIDSINNLITTDLQPMQDDSFDVDDILIDSGGNAMSGSDGNVMLK